MNTDNPAMASTDPPALSFKPSERLSGIKTNALESEIDHEKIDTDQLIVREA